MNAYAEARGPAGRTVGQKAIKPAEPEESALAAGAKRQRVGPSQFKQTKEALDVDPIVKGKWALVSPISTEHADSKLDQRVRLLIGDLREVHDKRLKLGEVCHTMKNGVHIYLACVHNPKWQKTHGGQEEMPRRNQMRAAARKIQIDMQRRELVQVACPDYAHEKITGFGRRMSRLLLNCFHESPLVAKTSTVRRCSRHPVVQNLERIKNMLEYEEGVDEFGTRDRLVKPTMLKGSKSRGANLRRSQARKRKFAASINNCRMFKRSKMNKAWAQKGL